MKDKKVLMISPQDFLYSNHSGGSQVSRRNYLLLIDIFGKENVSVLQMIEEIHENSPEFYGKQVLIKRRHINQYWAMLCLRNRYSKKNEREIKQYIDSERPDIVFFDGSMFGYIAKMIPRTTMIIAFYHNIEKRYARQKRNPLHIIHFFSAWMNEKYVTRTADIRICLNRRDDKLLYENYHMHSDYLLPVTFDDVGEENIQREFEDKNILLFVGSYFTPNVQGIKWFCKYVMPRIDKHLLIVGKGMERLKKLTAHNVHVIGGVDDLGTYYNMASAVVMPIFIGDGMKVKTAEAFMYGKTVFATDEALEGYDVEGIEGIHTCNTADEFVNAIIHEQQYHFRQENRNVFLKRYNTEACRRNFIYYLKQEVESREKRKLEEPAKNGCLFRKKGRSKGCDF